MTAENSCRYMRFRIRDLKFGIWSLGFGACDFGFPTMIWLWSIPVILILILVLAFSWRHLRFFGREVQAERAQELFALQRERLEAKFLDAAAASGKPRGLRWKAWEGDGPVAFARER